MDRQEIGKPNPFHRGEIAMQTAVGVAERMGKVGPQVIRNFMPDQHREFFAQLPFIVLGAVDASGDAWATLIAGNPGFLHSPDPQTLEFAAIPDPRDPGVAGLGDGSAIGLLGIELHTRRRNRMNGRVVTHDAGGLRVNVEHAFGNCPQYIQLRDWQMVRGPDDHLAVSQPIALDPKDPRVQALITAADTFFVASYIDDETGRHVDVSHRGGKPGFVRVNADGSLTIPDFAGNLHFSTLGNFLINPKAGLVFPDFETGDLLQLTGDAEVVLDSSEIAAFAGAERLWTFRPRRALLRHEALPLRFVFRPEGWSPNIVRTGDWDRVRCRLDAEKLHSTWRPLRVERIVEESIHAEAFGPASVDRQQAPAEPAVPRAAAGPVDVVFVRSGQEARWQPGSGTLLELAEASGLTPDFSCRNGRCGTCATRVLSGSVTYPSPPAARARAEHALICCALPAADKVSGSNQLVLDL